MGSQKPDVQGSPSAKAVNTKPYGKVILTLKNCLLPEEKLSPTPSQLDGLDRETETDLRILGCELIQTAGILLRLPQVAMATGQVLFQRFYYSKSFVRHGMETTAMGCVCLASKIEEAPKRIRDVINVFHHIKQMRTGTYMVSGGKPAEQPGHPIRWVGSVHWFGGHPCLPVSTRLSPAVTYYKQQP
ncbi:Cyclin-L1 [Frankliniella fusca]|uniref:Cyclin-L1 n=1 Tax=Frankliniella fusca TaxID=407009 RepID=A0AAE1GY09_9NEOP|nr:Cyclin-L1 [Frankliniella fusca]